jgi:hypothetical protein
MENATRRIRKARRQGLSPRARATDSRGMGQGSRAVSRSPNRLADMEKTPRPNRARKTRVTTRKAKRQSKAPLRSKR